MRPVSVSTTDASGAATRTSPVPLNYNAEDFKVSLRITVTGTANYTVQYSLDDPWAVYATDYNTNGRWVNSSDAAVVGATASQTTNFIVPVRAVRVVQNSGNGSTETTIVQQGAG